MRDRQKQSAGAQRSVCRLLGWWGACCALIFAAPQAWGQELAVVLEEADPRRTVFHVEALPELTESADASSKRNHADALPGAAAKMVSKLIELKSRKTPIIPSAKPKSPTRLTRNALIAAAFASGLSYQKPISR